MTDTQREIYAGRRARLDVELAELDARIAQWAHAAARPALRDGLAERAAIVCERDWLAAQLEAHT